MLSAIQMIAENKIKEAMRQGEFDNLPGKGLPLPDDGLGQVPEDLRMAYRLLKNSGYLPDEALTVEPVGTLAGMIGKATLESARIRQMQKLNIMLSKINKGRRTPICLDKNPEYHRRVVERVPLRDQDDNAS